MWIDAPALLFLAFVVLTVSLCGYLFWVLIRYWILIRWLRGFYF